MYAYMYMYMCIYVHRETERDVCMYGEASQMVFAQMVFA